MNIKQVEELILQSLEHEIGGIEVYTTAMTCAVNKDLKNEFAKYLAETRTHISTLESACSELRIDSTKETPGRAIVRHLGRSLVTAMEMALASGEAEAAELVACECVVIAETKDQLDWSLLGKCAENLTGKKYEILQTACDEIEGQEDEHLYHTKGWCRELWLKSLGMIAILPPLEEVRKVKTAIGAARAEQAAAMMR